MDRDRDTLVAGASRSRCPGGTSFDISRITAFACLIALGEVGSARGIGFTACDCASVSAIGTGHVVLSSISRQSRHRPLGCRRPDAMRFPWAEIRSGHILNGTGLATNPGGSFRRASCQLARSGPRFRSPMKHGTRGQAGSCPTELVSGDRGMRSRDLRNSVAVKTCPLGVMDPRRERKGSPPVVGSLFHIGGKRIPGSLGALCPPRPLGRDGPGNWDGTEVADRLPAKPAGSSEATGTVGQVDPPGQQKVVPP